jgi:hypothetical protein
MLITFKSRAYANITMFGDIGLKLLDMMGFGRRVPGAISARDVPQALLNLEQGLREIPQQPEVADVDEEGEEAAVSLYTRAVPLLELLRAAAADESAVSWE